MQPNVVIVMSRCNRDKGSFGIRLEEVTHNRWVADWVFAIKEEIAKKEGYTQREVAGTFALHNTYPGCPYCHAKSIFRCSCGKVNCWDGETHLVPCAWCEALTEIGGTIESLSTGEDH